jgi:hypothetical protein
MEKQVGCRAVEFPRHLVVTRQVVRSGAPVDRCVERLLRIGLNEDVVVKCGEIAAGLFPGGTVHVARDERALVLVKPLRAARRDAALHQPSERALVLHLHTCVVLVIVSVECGRGHDEGISELRANVTIEVEVLRHLPLELLLHVAPAFEPRCPLFETFDRGAIEVGLEDPHERRVRR